MRVVAKARGPLVSNPCQSCRWARGADHSDCLIPNPLHLHLLTLVVAVLLAMAGAVVGGAVAPSAKGGPLEVGQAYGLLRQQLLAAGWTPFRTEPSPGCDDGLADRRCRLFPELGSCSHTGLGLCRFDWRSPQGRPMAVITAGGDGRVDPGQVSHWFASD